jgi:hypothetical protein
MAEGTARAMAGAINPIDDGIHLQHAVAFHGGVFT